MALGILPDLKDPHTINIEGVSICKKFSHTSAHAFQDFDSFNVALPHGSSSWADPQ